MVSFSFPQVEYKGAPEDATLVLNKGLSTPYNVAQRKFLALFSGDPKNFRLRNHMNSSQSSIQIDLYSVG